LAFIHKHEQVLPDKPYWDALVRFKKMEVNLGASIRCPDGYTSAGEHEDLVRRDELFGKWRRSRPPLTREEDAEEAHLFARIACFKIEANGKVSHRRSSQTGDQRSAIEQSELDALEARFRRIPPKNGLIWLVDY
jgi:hypothetical protein